jgi:hypothetical protein
MRLRTLVSVLVTVVAVAAQNSPGRCLIARIHHDDGYVYEWYISRDTVASQQQWNPKKSGPVPLPTRALENARGWCCAKVGGDCDEIQLTQQTPKEIPCGKGSNRWCWLLEFARIKNGEIQGLPEPVAVLLDGTVVEPKVTVDTNRL